MPIALITGLTGQDGSYLAEQLVAEGIEVHGVVRPGQITLPPWLEPLRDRLRLHPVDLLNPTAVEGLVRLVQPDEVYHLAARSHVGESFADPAAVLEFNTVGTARLLGAVRSAAPSARFLHAGSAQVFGQPAVSPQTEDTPFRPVNPYGVSKAAACDLVRVVRDGAGVFAVNVFLYNHESPRRPVSFLTRKVCRGVAAIRSGRESELVLGDLSPRRDWGHARDHVRGMRLALRAAQPRDYILATGVAHSVEDWVAAAFGRVGLDWREHVRRDESLVRPSEPSLLVGDPSRAARELGWRPETDFEALVAEMVDAEIGPTAKG